MAKFTRRLTQAERYESTWNFLSNNTYTSGNVINLGSGIASNNIVYEAAIKFSGISVPQGSTINSAVLWITRQAFPPANPVYINIYCEDEDTCNGFTSNADFNAANLTSAYSNYNTTSWVGFADSQQSGIITNPIQEVINRAGWVNGNNIGVLIKYAGGQTFEAVDTFYAASPATEAYRAMLEIDYEESTPSSTNNITLSITGGVYSCSGEVVPDGDGLGKFHYRGDNYAGMYNLGFFPIIESGSTYFRAQNASYSGEYRAIGGTPVVPTFKNYFRHGSLGVGAVTYFNTAAQTRANNNFRNAIHFADSRYIQLPSYGSLDNYTVYMHTAPSGTSPRNGVIFSNGNADTEAGAFLIRYTNDVISAEYYTSVGVPVAVESTLGSTDNPHNFFVVSLASSGSPKQARMMLAVGKSDSSTLTTYESSPFYLGTLLDFRPVVGWSGYNNSYEGWLHEFGISNSGWTGSLSTNGVTTINTAYNNNYSYLLSASGNPADDSDYIEWKVPPGTGLAKIENVNYSLDAIDGYQLAGPADISPSAIYVELYVEHNTNHPSGVWIRPQVSLTTSYTPSTLYWNSEVLVPSGTKQKVIARPTNTNSSGVYPITFENVADQNLYLTTQYDQLPANPNYYGELKIYSATVKVDLYCENESVTSGIDLYTEGGQNVYDDVTLFVYNTTNSGVTPLYISGTAASGNSNIALFTVAATSIASSGNAAYPSGVRLYVNGIGRSTENFQLYTAAPIPPYTSGNTPLYMWSTTNSGVRNNISLYVNSQWEPQQIMPIFMQGDNALDTTSNMNLYLENDTILDNSVNLMLLGPSGINDNFNLYVAGLGSSSSSGYTPVDADMPLFMSRAEVAGGQFFMYMQVTESSVYSMPLYINNAWDAYTNTSLPSDISNLRLWLDAKDSTVLFQESGLLTPSTGEGTVIGGWMDKSPSGIHAWQTTTAAKPTLTYTQLGGKPTLKFSGNQFLDTTHAGFAQKTTMFLVAQGTEHSGYFISGSTSGSVNQLYKSTNGFDIILTEPTSSGEVILSSAVSWGVSSNTERLVANADNNFHVFTVVFDSGNIDYRLRVDGTSTTLASPGTQKDQNTRLGATFHSGEFLLGHIAEVIKYDKVLASGEMHLIEGYLAAKWGLLPSLVAGHLYGEFSPPLSLYMSGVITVPSLTSNSELYTHGF